MSDTNQIPAGDHIVEKETKDTNPDPRHQKRIRLMQALFSHSFSQEIDLPDDEQQTYDKIIFTSLYPLFYIPLHHFRAFFDYFS